MVSDGHGRVFELEQYQALGISGENVVEIPPDEWIPLPEGSQLMELPGRLPVGKDRRSSEVATLTENGAGKLLAVAALWRGLHHFLSRRLGKNATRPATFTFCLLSRWLV